MVEKCLNGSEHTADLSLTGVIGNSVNIQTVGSIVGNVEEGDTGALLWRVHGRRRIARRRVVRRHRLVGGSRTAHHPVLHIANTKNYRGIDSTRI
jgi:hypothetical protein